MNILSYVLLILNSLSTIVISVLIFILGWIFFTGFEKAIAYVTFAIAVLYIIHPLFIYIFCLRPERYILSSILSGIFLVLNVSSIRLIAGMIEAGARP